MDNQSEKDDELLEITTKNSQANIHCITIVGQIEGHTALQSEQKATKYENIMPRLVAVEESEEIDGLILLINTAGGDVEAGLAIAEAIAGMSKPTVAMILGGAHSIGIPIAVSANKTFIAKSASMTIHPVRMTGMVIGVHQSFEHFKKIQDRIIDFVVEHSKISKENFNKLMLETGELASDVGTIVNGKEAVEIGLCDEVGTLQDSLKHLHELIKNKKNNPAT